jgi:hypothetical protein
MKRHGSFDFKALFRLGFVPAFGGAGRGSSGGGGGGGGGVGIDSSDAVRSAAAR